LAYNISISKSAEKLLIRLSKTDKPLCRDLALLLLSMEKNPRPGGSRILENFDEITTDYEAREWKVARFEILYAVKDKTHAIDIAIINRE